MSFGTFPTWLALGGVSTLATVLYLLQRLKVRHRDLDVVTTLFWREAVEESQVRVFRRAFKHWPAYLLILAIASLAWLAGANPLRATDPAAMRHIVLLDASAAMANGDRFEQAVERARTLAETLPRDRTTVTCLADRRRTVLLPGEPLPAFDARVAELAASATPATIDSELNLLTSTCDADAPLTVHVVGTAPLTIGALGDLQVRHEPVASDDQPSGIIALGLSENGTWSSVDVYIETVGVTALQVTVDGVEEPLTTEGLADDRFVARNVAANGATLRVVVGNGLDDQAELVLPDRPMIDVALGPNVPEAILVALRLDPAVRLDGSDAPDVAIRPVGDPTGGSVPALEFEPAGDTAAFRVDLPSGAPYDTAQRLVADLALAEIDATALATATGRTIRLDVMPTTSGPRRIAVWSDLFTEQYDFVHVRAFPLFLTSAVRWLTDHPPVIPYAAVGEVVSIGGAESIGTAADTLTDAEGRAIAAAGGAVRPTAPGTYQLPDGRAVAVSLQSRSTATAAGDNNEPSAPLNAGASALDLVTIFGVLAMLGLVGEWMLFRRGRLP